MLIFILVMTASFTASLMAKVGVIIALIHGKNPYPATARIITPLGTGFLLGATFLLLLSPFSPFIKLLYVFPLIGIIISFLLDHYLNIYPINCNKPQSERRVKHVGTFICCLLIKCLLYGLIISIGFCMGKIVGVALSIGIIIKQYHEAIRNLSYLRDSTSLKRAIIISFFIPFFIPLSAAIFLVLYFKYGLPLISPLSSLILGVIIYMGISDLIQIPDFDLTSIFSLTIGVFLISLLEFFLL